jgi:hypothetical protein
MIRSGCSILNALLRELGCTPRAYIRVGEGPPRCREGVRLRELGRLGHDGARAHGPAAEPAPLVGLQVERGLFCLPLPRWGRGQGEGATLHLARAFYVPPWLSSPTIRRMGPPAAVSRRRARWMGGA